MKILHKFKYLLFIFLVAGFALLFFASSNKPFAQWYALNIYPWVSKVIGFIPSLMTISLAEIFAAAFIIVIVVYIVKFFVGLVRGKKNKGTLVLNFFVNPLLLASVLFFVFVANMGVNYYRTSFVETAGIPDASASTQDLISLCSSLAEDCNNYSTGMLKSADGTTQSAQTFGVLSQYVSETYSALGNTYPTLRENCGNAKPVFGSEFLSRLNLTGITVPFTSEANVNTDIPDFSIPFTMAHELSHVKGYMQEDEANFLAYLVCSKSGYTELNYSAAIMGFIYAGNALNKVDSSSYINIYNTLNNTVTSDLQYNYNYWLKYRGAAADISSSVNSAYLQANGQTDGIESYGKMVDIMLDYYIQNNYSAKYSAPQNDYSNQGGEIDEIIE